MNVTLHHNVHFADLSKDLEMGIVWVSPQCHHCFKREAKGDLTTQKRRKARDNKAARDWR